MTTIYLPWHQHQITATYAPWRSLPPHAMILSSRTYYDYLLQVPKHYPRLHHHPRLTRYICGFRIVLPAISFGFCQRVQLKLKPLWSGGHSGAESLLAAFYMYIWMYVPNLPACVKATLLESETLYPRYFTKAYFTHGYIIPYLKLHISLQQKQQSVQIQPGRPHTWHIYFPSHVS